MILKELNPDIIALCETKKTGRVKKDELQNYTVIECNAKQGKEGLLFGIRTGSFNSVREVTDTELKNIVSLRVEYARMNLRIIIAHAPQDNAKCDERSGFFEELNVQIERGETIGDQVIVLGDFNARIENDDDQVLANNDSPNGKRLKEVLEKYQLNVCNFHENAEGKWTRIQGKKDGVSKSILDYILVQECFFHSLTQFIVDEEKIYTPYRQRMIKGERKVTYTDHCAIIMQLEIATGRTPQSKAAKQCWKFSDEDGLRRYCEESTYSLEFDVSGSSTTAYGNWLIAFEKLLGKCFQRRTIKTRSTPAPIRKFNGIRDIISRIGRKGKVQRAISKMYQQKLVEAENEIIQKSRAEKLKKTVSQLTANDKFSPSGYWKMKKSVKKAERKTEVVSSIKKANGVEVDGPDAIKEAYREEFEKRLANRLPKEGWEEFVEETNSIIRRWLKSPCYSSLPFTLKELKLVVSRLKNNKSPGVDGLPAELFKYASDGVLKSLLTVYNKIKKTRDVPSQFDDVRIATIYKQKGSKKMLKYYRGIFLTILVSKIFEYLIKNRIETKLNNINILQAGSRTNRSGPDNIFLLRGCIDHFKFIKKPLFLTAYDFEQAFDSLWLEDCIMSLKDLGIEKEYLQLIYNMNESARITVQTPFGETSKFTSDPIVKQGTILGPSLCSSSTGEYCGINVGVCVGDLLIASLLYVDDIVDLSLSIEDCIAAHVNAIHFANKKKLRYSGTKCFVLVVNGRGKVDAPKLIIDDQNNVIVVTEITYLGDVFNSKGDNDNLIEDRVKRGIKAMVTIASLMSEVDVGSHHVSTNLLLYQSLFLSTILFNSQTWSNLRKQDIKALTTIQLKFLKRIVGVSSSTANSFIFLELGVLPVEHEIAKRQIMYLHRILQLDTSDPVRKMFENLKTFHESGECNWWTEVVEKMKNYGLDVNLEEINSTSKGVFSKQVKEAIKETAFAELLNECSSLQKTSDLQYQSLKVQDYLLKLPPHQARGIFRWRSKTLDIKTHRTYKYDNTLCRGCGNCEETAEHVVNCGRETVIPVIDVGQLGEVQDIRDQLVSQVGRLLSFIERVTP